MSGNWSRGVESNAPTYERPKPPLPGAETSDPKGKKPDTCRPEGRIRFRSIYPTLLFHAGCGVVFAKSEKTKTDNFVFTYENISPEIAEKFELKAFESLFSK